MPIIVISNLVTTIVNLFYFYKFKLFTIHVLHFFLDLVRLWTARAGQVWEWQVRDGHGRSRTVGAAQCRSGQVRASQYRSGHVRTGHVRTGLARVGLLSNDLDCYG